MASPILSFLHLNKGDEDDRPLHDPLQCASLKTEHRDASRTEDDVPAQFFGFDLQNSSLLRQDRLGSPNFCLVKKDPEDISYTVHEPEAHLMKKECTHNAINGVINENHNAFNTPIHTSPSFYKEYNNNLFYTERSPPDSLSFKWTRGFNDSLSLKRNEIGGKFVFQESNAANTVRATTCLPCVHCNVFFTKEHLSKHECMSATTESDSTIPSQSPNYLSCVHCNALFLQENLYTHECEPDSEENNATTTVERTNYLHGNGLFLQENRYLQVRIFGKSHFISHLNCFKSVILNGMRPSHLSVVVENDELICQLGVWQISQGYDKQYIRTRMRELAKLLLAMRLTCGLVSFQECIDPAVFPAIINEIKMSGKYRNRRPEKYLTESLRQLAEIVKFNTLFPETKRKATEFLQLLAEQNTSRTLPHDTVDDEEEPSPAKRRRLHFRPWEDKENNVPT